MPLKYYPDTSIWIDLYEGRKGYNGEPLGKYAFKLFTRIIARKERIIVSDIILKELSSKLSLAEITSMMLPFKGNIGYIRLEEPQKEEAIRISKNLDVPLGDAMHSILARDNLLILVTRDKHFRLLADISEPYRPEELS